MGASSRLEATAAAGPALADALREIIRELNANEVDEARLREALVLAERMRGLLDAPRRLRWYDLRGDAGEITQASHDAYLAMGPIRGEANPVAPPLRMEHGVRDDGTPCIRGRARLPIQYEGPPHGVHGGWVAALFDDLLGHAQGLASRGGVTARLTVSFRQVTPIEEELHLEAWVHEERDRRTLIRATCHAGETLTAEAEGLFIAVDFEEVRARMRERRP